MLGDIHAGFESEFALNLFLYVRDGLNQRELINRLGIIRNRPIAVNGDRDGPHTEKAERDQTEGEDR